MPRDGYYVTFLSLQTQLLRATVEYSFDFRSQTDREELVLYMAIRLKLHPPLEDTSPIRDLMQLRHGVRVEAVKLLRSNRRRARSSYHRRKIRAVSEGYATGISEARKRFDDAIRKIVHIQRGAYEEAITSTTKLAVEMAKTMVGETLARDPSHYERWLREAIEILHGSSSLRITYHPSLEPLFSNVDPELAQSVYLQADTRLECDALELTGDRGSIEIAWRKAIEQEPGV